MNIPKHLLLVLKDFQDWKTGGPENSKFDLLDYVCCVATPDLFFGFFELFYPPLVKHEGEYFLASHFDTELYEEWKSKLEDNIAIQKVMNHIHISTIFQNQEITDELAHLAAKCIAEIWSYVFRKQGLIGIAWGKTLEDAQVTLYRASEVD